jgi:P-type Cu+ transporter
MADCFHCGDDCSDVNIVYKNKSFCCNGCKTVYAILSENDLTYYYELDQNPGSSPKDATGKFDFLENDSIAEKLLEFDDGTTRIVSFLIPKIHCSSCIWVLENLSRLNNGIKSSQVNFPEKTLRVTFSSESISLKRLVQLLTGIGYEPNISLEDYTERKKRIDRSLIYKLGIAGFAFGNVMFLSFPEYFEANEFWLEKFKYVFRWMMFAFSLPVVFYSGRDFFISAFKGIRLGILNIDVPIALGIAVLFIRSTLDISLDWGSGFFDSLTGLIFFLLLGKFFQQKTFAFLSFERDYRSYFPIAVTRIKRTSASEIYSEEQIQVYDIKQGDRVLIRNEELIPVDGVLCSESALIDYSFVTGESEALLKVSGDKLFAGGKQKAGVIEVEVIKPIEQSYLTQLWGNEIFDKKKESVFQNLTDSISKQFTISVLTIAFLATLFWLLYDPGKAFNVFTAVLIVACPCAIALASPFTLGNLLRIFGRNQFYLKEVSVIEQMAKIDTVVFDKTGTLTSNNDSTISYRGNTLSIEESVLLTSTLRASNHPLSRALYNLLDKHNIQTLDEFEERPGEGISGSLKTRDIKVGSYSFVDDLDPLSTEDQFPALNKTAVHISSNNAYKGCYVFHSEYRDGVADVFNALQPNKELIVLSGDNDGEREHLEKLLPKEVVLKFDQKPEDKLNYIRELQQQGKRVMMVGDGLNDAGALTQSDVGIVVSEDINVFSPASDGILDASKFKDITRFFEISQKGISVIKWSFLLSLVYNLVGLVFAITGHLKPVIAAILMPLSSISIVVFTTIMTQIISSRIRKNSNH